MIKQNFMYLFFSLILIFVLYPFFENNLILINIISSAIVISSVYSISSEKKAFLIGLILAGGAFVANWFMIIDGSNLVMGINAILTVLFYGFTMYQIIRYIMNANEVNMQVIFAAISLYILVGITWGFAYTLIELVKPGSFYFSEQISRSQFVWPDLLYFSFITLTTLGYGDIVPISALARSFTIIEAIMGVFYIAITISRLVSLYKTEDKKERSE
ncbi:two pore domain potassium channel family protein [Candidatus Micrarchaeota archaeon]|nr:two pore domain potassium channel family protein [Candidatus Micrarchaeota archaeon]